MKKVLSFVLVLAMILGSVSMAFAAPATSSSKVNVDTTVKPFVDAQDSYVATILRDLGAIKGTLNENGEYVCKPEDELTRAEAAALVVIAMGLGDQAQPTATKFTDVPADAWYSGYVAVAAAQGYVGGTSATTFEPEAKMSMDMAIALMLKVLGYSDAHLQGSWPANFRDLALRRGILTDISYGTQNATRGDMFQVLYNCLDQRLYVWNPDSDSADKYDIAPNGLLLIQKMTGTQTSLGYYGTRGAVVLTENNANFANKFDASDFYGKKVIILKKKGQDIGIYKVSTESITGKFAANGNTTTFTAIDGTVYKNVPLATTTNLFINGGVTAAGTYAVDKTVTYTLDVELDDVKTTSITALHAMHFDRIDAVDMVNVTEAALLNADNLYKLTKATADVNAQYKNLGTTNAGLEKNAVLDTKKYPLVVEGAAASLAEIKENDIVEFCLNPNTGMIAKLIVTRDVKTGAITNFDSKNTKYTLGGKAYSIGTTVAAITDVTDNVTNAIKGATEVAFYLNSAGKIAFAEIVDKTQKWSDYRYAIVLDADTTNDFTLDGKALKGTSNAAIRLLPIDTMVEEKYELVSSGAISGSAFTSTNVWDPTVTATKNVVKFATLGTELAYLDDAAPDFQTVLNVTFAATGLAEISKIYASDVKIVAGHAATGKVATEAAYYAVKTIADVKKATSATIEYKLNADNKIAVIFVDDFGKDAAPAIITAAAITGVDTDAKGDYVTYLQPGASEAEKLYVVKNGPSAAVLKTLTKQATLFAITLSDGKLATTTDLSLTKVVYTTTGAANLTFDAVKGTLADEDGNVEATVLDTVKVMKYNNAAAVAALENVDLDDVNDILAKAKEVIIYKAYNDTFGDVIVIR